MFSVSRPSDGQVVVPPRAQVRAEEGGRKPPLRAGRAVVKVRCPRLRRVFQQLHETEVHMQLYVTVEQGQSWIIRDEIDRCGAMASDADEGEDTFENCVLS